jgi:hypothetical protein
MARPSDEQYRTWARADIGKTDGIVIDSDAQVSYADDGAWVAAWIWIADPEPEEEENPFEHDSTHSGCLPDCRACAWEQDHEG